MHAMLMDCRFLAPPCSQCLHVCTTQTLSEIHTTTILIQFLYLFYNRCQNEHKQSCTSLEIKTGSISFGYELSLCTDRIALLNGNDCDIVYVNLYIYSPVHFRGLVLNSPSTGSTLNLILWSFLMHEMVRSGKQKWSFTNVPTVNSILWNIHTT